MEKKVIMPIFLASIMILSVLGFAFTSGDGQGSVKFNGYKFSKTNQGWLTYRDNQQILIASDPRTLDLSNTPKITLNDLNSANKIYLTTNPEENLQQYLAYFSFNILPKLKNKIPACIKDVEGCEELPLKTCEDATISNKIIQIEFSETQETTYQNNCLLIKGNADSLYEQIDAVILQLTINS